MKKEFIPYEQALALKELGFDEPCFGLFHKDGSFYRSYCTSHEQYYGQVCSAPTYYQCFRWFREKYKLEGDISHFNDGRFKWSYQIKNITDNPELSKIISSQP